MAKRKPEEINDLEECKRRIEALLREYNCEMMSADEWHSVLIRDKDTDETTGIRDGL